MKTQQERTATTGNQIETIEEEPRVLEEIEIEELGIDGICGVY
jgi:mycofactocin precursor